MTPTNLFKHIAAACAAALIAGAASASTVAPPNVLVTFTEDLSLSQIEITVSGALDLTDFTFLGPVPVAPGSALVPSGALVILSPGPVGYDNYELEPGAVPVFGVPIANACSASTGGVFAFSGGSIGVGGDPDFPGYLSLPSGYTSGTALSGSITCPGFAPGFSPFAYYGITGSDISVALPGDQTMLLTFETAPSAVPLPATGWLLLAGIAAGGAVARRRKG